LWGEKTVKDLVAHYRQNRDFCMQKLLRMPGVTLPKPEGAFYLFPRIEGLTNSFGFCKQLLMDTQVGLAPGVAFGAGGEGSVRICYASERSILEPAMDRLGEFLAGRRAHA
jgi:aspartate/methionine/tyrosine aminotransferase